MSNAKASISVNAFSLSNSNRTPERPQEPEFDSSPSHRKENQHPEGLKKFRLESQNTCDSIKDIYQTPPRKHRKRLAQPQTEFNKKNSAALRTGLVRCFLDTIDLEC